MEASVIDTPRNAVDPRQFRNVIGSFGTGVAIVTACADGREYGMAVNSLTSVSLDPCLLLVCIRNGSRTGAAIKQAGSFGVSVLAHDQHEVCKAYCAQGDAQRRDQLTEMVDGVPLVRDTLAGIVCELHEVVQAGDHEILMGRVRQCTAGDGAPLMFFRGSFGGFDDLAADAGAGAQAR